MNIQNKNWKQQIDKLYTDLEVIRTKFIELEQEAKREDLPVLFRTLSAFRWSLMTPWEKEDSYNQRHIDKAAFVSKKAQEISVDSSGKSIAAALDEAACIADERDRYKREGH